MEIKYNKKNNVTENKNNHVGPCTDTAIRSGFDCAASTATYNDTNCRFFKSTGASGNTGLFASPMDTLENAVAKAVTDGKTNVACLDDVADFEGVTTSDIPANFKIVAANGKAPRLKWGANDQSIRTGYQFGRLHDDTIQTQPIIEGNNRLIANMKHISGTYVALTYYSDNNGVSWTESTPSGNGNHGTTCILKTDTRIIVGRDDAVNKGIWISDDNAVTWTSKYTSNGIANIIYDKVTSTLYASYDTGGGGGVTYILTSIDNGNNWTGAYIVFARGFLLAADNGTVYYRCNTSTDIKIYKSTNPMSNNDWINILETTPNYDFNHLNIAENNDLYIYKYAVTGTDRGFILKSINEGATWEDITGSITTYSHGLLTYHDGILYYLTGNSSSNITKLYQYRDSWQLLIDMTNTGFTQNWYKLPILRNTIYFDTYTTPASVFYIRSTKIGILQQLNNTLEINGFYLDGNNKQAVSLLSGTGSQTNTTLKYCELDEYYYKAVSAIDTDTLTMQYCKIDGGKYGVGD